MLPRLPRFCRQVESSQFVEVGHLHAMTLLQIDDALFLLVVQRTDKVHVEPPAKAVLLHAGYALAESSVWQGQLDCAALTEWQVFQRDYLILVGVAFENLRIVNLVWPGFALSQRVDGISHSSRARTQRGNGSIQIEHQAEVVNVCLQAVGHLQRFSELFRRFLNMPTHLLETIDEVANQPPLQPDDQNIRFDLEAQGTERGDQCGLKIRLTVFLKKSVDLILYARVLKYHHTDIIMLYASIGNILR